mgnify:CR=1 FL=1
MWSKHRLSLGLLLTIVAVCGCDCAVASTGKVNSGPSAKVTPGYLGIDIRDVTPDQLVPLKLKEARGAEITDVDHDGPACKAGLQLYDVILQMDGQAIEGQEQLRKLLREEPAGKTVVFVISRNGQQQTISALMADREEVEREAWDQRYRVPEPPSWSAHVGNGFMAAGSASALPPEPKGHRDFLAMSMILSSSFTGAKLEIMGPQLAEYFGAVGAGLLVRSVDADSPAEVAGMKAGDVVVRINQIPVSSGNDWSRTIHDNRGRPVSVVVLRNKQEHTLILTPDSKKRSSLGIGTTLERYFSGMKPLIAEFLSGATMDHRAQLGPVT